MNIKKRLKQKGFTLIELIVVVVIVAVLAALILPRFLSQPERAVIAEAQNTLGTLRRAQLLSLDTTGTTLRCVSALACNNALSTQIADTSTGLANPKYDYACTGGTVAANLQTAICTATRLTTGGGGGQINGNNIAGSTVALTEAGVWSCDETTYHAQANNRGCGV